MTQKEDSLLQRTLIKRTEVMNRRDKIILLKGIQSGAIPIDTIQPRLFRVEGHTIPNGGGSKCFHK